MHGTVLPRYFPVLPRYYFRYYRYRYRTGQFCKKSVFFRYRYFTEKIPEIPVPDENTAGIFGISVFSPQILKIFACGAENGRNLASSLPKIFACGAEMEEIWLLHFPKF